MTAKDSRPGYFWPVPLLLYFFWVIGPAFYTMYLSLTEWDGLSAPIFIGFDNFRLLFFDDPVFITSLMNNVKWLLIFLVIPVILGLSLAMILKKNIRGEKFLKQPSIPHDSLSGSHRPDLGLVYDPAGGLLNMTLSFIGIKGIIAALMGLSKAAAPAGGRSGYRAVLYYCSGSPGAHTGYVMILYLTGLKGIPGDVIEAAKVDGAKG